MGEAMSRYDMITNWETQYQCVMSKHDRTFFKGIKLCKGH